MSKKKKKSHLKKGREFLEGQNINFEGLYNKKQKQKIISNFKFLGATTPNRP
jgi:hypothetical protein